MLCSGGVGDPLSAWVGPRTVIITFIEIFLGFSFLLGLPIFNAVIMGDAVIRDFRFGIDPLIFSKPISRAEYLLGKFFGNFFVLVCCQSVFTLTLFVLQGFSRSKMVVQPFQVVPYFKHFFLLVVVSHLLLAAFYFALGTLTRNAKIVYGVAVAFYPLYFAYLTLLKEVPQSWAVLLDPMLVTSTLKGSGFNQSAEFLNQLSMSYSPMMLANRALVVMCAAVCLGILYLRFTMSERSVPATNLTTLSLSTASGGVYFDRGTFEIAPVAVKSSEVVLLPEVSRTSNGSISKLIGALLVEFRLLCAERSLIVLLPLAIMLSTLEITFFRVVPDFSYSATYATNTAGTLLLFIVGIIIFYTGEAVHRDRELRIEPVLWSTPAPNSVFLISKFLLTVLLSFVLIGAVGLTAIVVQVARGHRPIEITPYVLVYGIVLLPSVIFLCRRFSFSECGFEE